MSIQNRIIAGEVVPFPIQGPSGPSQEKGIGGKVIRFLVSKGIKQEDVKFVGRISKGDGRYKGLVWNINSTNGTAKTKKVLTEMYGPGYPAWPDWFFWKGGDTLVSLRISKGGGANWSVLTISKRAKWLDKGLERFHAKQR